MKELGNETAIAKKLIDKLKKLGYTVSCAESCTGGLVTHLITRVSGASDCLSASIVTYSNSAKSQFLGIPMQVIEKHGAVSQVVAEAMAKGICKTTGANVGISITGIAGPGGGTPNKPVGTVWLGACVGGKTITAQVPIYQGAYIPTTIYLEKEKQTTGVFQPVIKGMERTDIQKISAYNALALALLTLPKEL